MKANRIKPLPTGTLALGLVAAALGFTWWRWSAAEPALTARTRARLLPVEKA